MSIEPAVLTERDGGIPEAMGKDLPFAQLGAGGMADIFLAVARWPVGFNKLAVIKQLRHLIEGEVSHLDMFMDEARIAARLNHPNIVHTYEVGEAHGKYFIAMEYLEGQSLRALTSKLNATSDGLDESLILYIATQVLKGLHCAHELCDFDGTPIGIVHRDVSPHNLYITYAGEVKVLDFGIAKAKTNSTQTETGVLKGKIRYMAPEQLGERDIDRRADIFAFGVVLWELLARRPLFQGDAGAIVNRLANEDAPSVRGVNPLVSVELDGIVRKALQRDRTERFATADEMRMPLEALLHQQGGSEKGLSRLMNGLFATARDEARERIHEFLHEGASEDGRAPASGRVLVRELPPLFGGSGPHTPLLGLGATNVTRIIDPARRRRQILVAGAVATSLGAVLVIAGLGHPKPAPAITSAPAVAEAPSAGRGESKSMAIDKAPDAGIELSIVAPPQATLERPAPHPSSPSKAPRLPRAAAPRTHDAPPSAPRAAVSATPALKIRPLDDSDSP
ncbi:MAG: serine/threonine protein kinase [Polyangiaceae bacterium]